MASPGWTAPVHGYLDASPTESNGLDSQGREGDCRTAVFFETEEPLDAI